MSSQPCSTGVPAVSPPKPRGDSLPHHSGEEDADAAVSLTAAVYEGRSSGSRELRLLQDPEAYTAERSRRLSPPPREDNSPLLPAGSSADSPEARHHRSPRKYSQPGLLLRILLKGHSGDRRHACGNSPALRRPPRRVRRTWHHAPGTPFIEAGIRKKGPASLPP